MNTIQEQWDSFLADVIPSNAPMTQRVEMRKAFYCGAIAMIDINYTVGGDGNGRSGSRAKAF